MGVNAIMFAARLCGFIEELAQDQADHGLRDTAYETSSATLSINTITGGTAMNIVPSSCTFLLDIRALTDASLDDLIGRIRTFCGTQLVPEMQNRNANTGISIKEVVRVNGLATDPSDPAVHFVRQLLPDPQDGKVDFATEAGAFEKRAGITSIVCGPGSMAQGHQPDEYIEIKQIRRMEAMLTRLAERLEVGI
jgi:acetylornithine deacetylase